MKRVLCSWFLRWPIHRRYHTQPTLKKRPLVLFAETAQRLRVTACCPRAEQQGVRIGQPLADAKVFLPAANYLAAEPEADRAALRELALDAQRFTPLVGLEEGPEPRSLFSNIAGCTHLWNGEQPFFQDLVGYWTSRGYVVRHALADTLGSAWASTHYGPATSLIPSGRESAVLGDLPVAALRLPETIVTRLTAMGLRRIRDVLKLPRETLPARFGAELLMRIDQALGARDELFVAERLREPLVVSRAWEDPLTSQFAISSANRDLLRQLLAQVAQHSVGLQEARGTFQTETGAISVDLQLVEPTTDERHWQELVELRMERQPWPGGVTKITWTALRLGTLPRQQGHLFDDDDRAESSRALATLVDRLTSRLGVDAVLRVQVEPDAQPEQAVTLVPWTASRTTGNDVLLDATWWRHRPMRLLAPPERLEVMSVIPDGPPLRMRWHGRSYRVTRQWGPERIETGWWRADDAQRDYYRVEWDDGAHVWTFRDRRDGTWWVHGFFD